MPVLLTIGMVVHATLNIVQIEKTNADGLDLEFRYILTLVSTAALWMVLSTLFPDPVPPPPSPWPDPWPPRYA